MPSSHLILCRALFLLPSIPPSIRVFSNGSTLCMRWPKYWNFSFSVSPSNKHPGLISFRMDLPQEIRKWTNKHKASRKKKRNMKAEFNENENGETIEKISKTKSWFFKHFNRIDRLLLRLTEIKRKKTQITHLQNEVGNISSLSWSCYCVCSYKNLPVGGSLCIIFCSFLWSAIISKCF